MHVGWATVSHVPLGEMHSRVLLRIYCLALELCAFRDVWLENGQRLIYLIRKTAHLTKPRHGYLVVFSFGQSLRGLSAFRAYTKCAIGDDWEPQWLMKWSWNNVEMASEVPRYIIPFRFELTSMWLLFFFFFFNLGYMSVTHRPQFIVCKYYTELYRSTGVLGESLWRMHSHVWKK